MGDIFESTVPEEHYNSEINRLSDYIINADNKIDKCKKALIDLKVETRNLQFYEPDNLDLEKIIEIIEKTLKEIE